MRISSLLGIGLSLGVVLLADCGAVAQAPASPAASKPRQPYEGVWAASRTACRDRDGVDRMIIEGDRFSWYETRCRARDLKVESAQSWAMRMSCEGEGERIETRSRLSLTTRDKLTLDDAPVGPTKRQVYVRCTGRPPR